MLIITTMPSAIGAVGRSSSAQPTLDIVPLSESAHNQSYVMNTYQKRTRNLRQSEGILH